MPRRSGRCTSDAISSNVPGRMEYFQNVLRTSGIIDKLEEMGIEEGDTVSIFDFEFEYLR